MDDKFDVKIVIEDARHRHGAILALIYAMDAQALTLLRIYVTVGVAALAGALATLSPVAPHFPPLAVWGLLALFAVMIYGAVWCFTVVVAAKINLPGRKADFWLWALSPDVTTETALKEYLTDLVEQNKLNDDASFRSAFALMQAKYAGAAALALAVAVAAYVCWLRLT